MNLSKSTRILKEHISSQSTIDLLFVESIQAGFLEIFTESSHFVQENLSTLALSIYEFQKNVKIVKYALF